MSKTMNPNINALGVIAERIIDGLPESGHSHARQLYNSIARLALGINALEEMRRAPNPSETSASHQKKVMASAVKLSQLSEITRERLHEITREGLHEIDSRIAQKVNFVPSEHAREIREVYRRMNLTDQTKLLAELVEQNRGPEFAAIVKVPAVLTDLAPEIGLRYTQALLQKHAPDEVAEKESLMERFDIALLAASTVADAAKGFTDPVALAKIERDEAAANAAAAKFDTATQ